MAEHPRNLNRKDWLLVAGVLVIILAVLMRVVL
jgi:hypothetical protein